MTSSYTWLEPFELSPPLPAAHFVDCLITTQEGQYLLQWHPEAPPAEAALTAFGGHLRAGETPEQALMRQLETTLGAKVVRQDLTPLGSVIEEHGHQRAIVHLFAWHDHLGTICGCDESVPMLFNRPEDLLAHPQLAPHVRWGLGQAFSEAA